MGTPDTVLTTGGLNVISSGNVLVTKTGGDQQRLADALANSVSSGLTVEDDTGHTIASVGTLQMVGVVVSGSTPSAIANMTTITAADGTGTAAGADVKLVGGNAGPSATTAFGGSIQIQAGNGGGGTSSTYAGGFVAFGGSGGSGATIAQGGRVVFEGGPGGVTANGPGGLAGFYGGPGYGAGAGGSANLYGGRANGAGAGGSVYIAAGSSVGGGAGGGIKINLGSGSTPGQFAVNNDPSLLGPPYSWVAGAQLNNQTIFTTTRAALVTAVIGRVDVANGSAATLVIVKAPNTVAPADGTALTSTSMDLTGAANANQTLTLSATLADITLAAGDSLCMVTTGALAASAGCITVWGTPQ